LHVRLSEIPTDDYNPVFDIYTVVVCFPGVKTHCGFIFTAR